MQGGRHGRHLENLFLASSSEPKGQVTRNLLWSTGLEVPGRLVDQKQLKSFWSEIKMVAI